MFLLTFSALFADIFCMDDLEDKVEVKSDHIVGRTDVLDKTFSISFWLKVKSVTKKSKLLFVETKPEGKDGKMLLSLTLMSKGKLLLKKKIDKKFRKKMIGKIKLDKSYHLKISQKLINDQVFYIFSVSTIYFGL